jgi:hypothetical protein
MKQNCFCGGDKEFKKICSECKAELKGFKQGQEQERAKWRAGKGAFIEGQLSSDKKWIDVIDKEILLTETNCNCPNGFEYSPCWHRVQVLKELKQQIEDTK